MEKIQSCPLCFNSEFSSFLTCVDYTVSNKEFTIVECKACKFKFTTPRPFECDLGEYYKAEEYISHSDTKKGLMNKLYHLIRKYTLIKKLQLLVRTIGRPSAIKSKSLLDIGCGTGAFLDVCNKAGFNCLGIEPDEAARKLASFNYQLDVRGEMDLSKLKAESFDIITLWHVMEHMPHLNEIVEQIKQLLKHSGRVIVAVPNCTSFDAKYYNKFWAAYDVPRHLYHFTPNDMNVLAKRHDLKVVRVLPMYFDSFYVSMLSEKYKTGKVNYLKAFVIGLRSNLSAIKSGNTFSSQVYVLSK